MAFAHRGVQARDDDLEFGDGKRAERAVVDERRAIPCDQIIVAAAKLIGNLLVEIGEQPREVFPAGEAEGFAEFLPPLPADEILLGPEAVDVVIARNDRDAMALGGLNAEQVGETDEELSGLRELFLLRPFREIAGDGDDVRLELEVAFQSGQVFTQAGEEHVVGEVATGAAPRVESPEDMVLPKLRVREVQECDGVTGHGPDDSGASRALAMQGWRARVNAE